MTTRDSQELLLEYLDSTGKPAVRSLVGYRMSDEYPVTKADRILITEPDTFAVLSRIGDGPRCVVHCVLSEKSIPIPWQYFDELTRDEIRAEILYQAILVMISKTNNVIGLQ